MGMSPRLLRPRESGGFNPKMISGLKVWLDASDGSTLTMNGSTVSEWRDKSGNGYHFTQSTASKQPTLSTTYFSKGALHFDGVDDVMSNQTPANWKWTHSDEATWAIALRLSDGTDEKQTDVPTLMGTVEQYFNANPIGFLVWTEDRSPSIQNRAQLFVHNDGDGNVLNATWLDNSMPEASNNALVIRYALAGTNTRSLTKNGTTIGVALDGAETAAPSTANPTFGLSIGANSHNNYDGARFGKWRIAELIGWSRSVNDDERRSVNRYLGGKWGVAIS
jgi:hypothetical protein